MANPTINAVLTYTDEQIAALTAPEIEWLADGLPYFDPWVAGIQVTSRYHEVISQIKTRRSAKVAPHPAPKSGPTLKRADCGHMTAFPMTTTRGTACDNCYDRMSN